MIEFVINWLLLAQVGVATLLPLVVALVTTKMTPSSRKAVLLLALSALTSLLTQLVDALTTGAVFDLFAALVMAFVTFIVAVAMHFGVWRSETANGNSVESVLADVGGPKHRAG